MKLTPVKSSNIDSVGYDPTRQAMRVKFKNGGMYEHSDVSARDHQALVSAPSIGSHYAKHHSGKKHTKL